jgi:hypothetical protein
MIPAINDTKKFGQFQIEKQTHRLVKVGKVVKI